MGTGPDQIIPVAGKARLGDWSLPEGQKPPVTGRAPPCSQTAKAAALKADQRAIRPENGTACASSSLARGIWAMKKTILH